MTPRPIAAALLAGVAFLSVPTAAAPQGTTDPRVPRIDALVRAYAESDQFAGAVLVAESGRVLYRRGAGVADRELDVAASPDHRFIIGSMTKAFTALLVLQEVHDGRLRLDEPVIRYWPAFPDSSGGRITIRHLLAHRSGLPHWGAVDDFLVRDARLTHAPEDIVRLYAARGLRFVPGEDDAYSSLGYVVLGVVLERVTGKGLGGLMRERIFEPLDMTATMLDDGATIVPGRVRAYRYNFLQARYDNAEYRDPSTTGATGGIITTVDDLLKWDQALYTEQLLPSTLRHLLFDPTQGEAAFGWRETARLDGDTVVWHGGQVTGYRSQISRVPSRRWTVIVLANLRDAAVSAMSDDLVALLAGDDVELPRRSLMKEILRVSAHRGSAEAIRRFGEIRAGAGEEYDTAPTGLLIAAIELRSDDACDRAAPLYEHWLATYERSPYIPRALRDAADCRLRLGQPALAAVHVQRLAEVDPNDSALADLRARLR